MSAQIYSLRYLTVLSICYLLFTGCQSSGKREKPDVSHIPLQYRTIRFDQEVFKLDTLHLLSSVNALGNRYPDFSNVYFKEITGLARMGNDTLFEKSLKHFLTYKDYRNLYDTVQKYFPDCSKTDRELQQLFRLVKYYFPEQKLGDVYYFISGLNSWSAITVDTALGIGLDMYLGKQYPYYASVQMPQYEIEHCIPEYIPINAARVIYQNIYPHEAEGKTLLDLMLMKGRELIFAEHVLPDVPEEKLLGYTPEQLAWCYENEAMIWHYFSVKKLLYATNWQDILPYVNDGPTSVGMPPESPGNIGSWIGWQICRQYLKKNPDIKWVQSLQPGIDAQAYLRAASYRPK